MSDNPKEQGVWNVPVLLETIERNRRERDEARAVARRLYAENKKLKLDKMVSDLAEFLDNTELDELRDENARLQQENKAYVREYYFAFQNWQEYAQRCQDYYSEIYRLRARLQELETEQEPGP